jgi:hypothetical protein
MIEKQARAASLLNAKTLDELIRLLRNAPIEIMIKMLA